MMKWGFGGIGPNTIMDVRIQALFNPEGIRIRHMLNSLPNKNKIHTISGNGLQGNQQSNTFSEHLENAKKGQGLPSLAHHSPQTTHLLCCWGWSPQHCWLRPCSWNGVSWGVVSLGSGHFYISLCCVFILINSTPTDPSCSPLQTWVSTTKPVYSEWFLFRSAFLPLPPSLLLPATKSHGFSVSPRLPWHLPFSTCVPGEEIQVWALPSLSFFFFFLNRHSWISVLGRILNQNPRLMEMLSIFS